MTGKIFINYRRSDDPGFTLALYMRLEEEFTAVRLFMDVEGYIKGGDDFVDLLRHQLAECDVFLSVIGPRWEDALAARRGDPDDFVFIEIKAALTQQKRVIPVLVGGAKMPRADILPYEIKELARKQAIELRPNRFIADCKSFVNKLTQELTQIETARQLARRKRQDEDSKQLDQNDMQLDLSANHRMSKLLSKHRCPVCGGRGVHPECSCAFMLMPPNPGDCIGCNGDGQCYRCEGVGVL